MVRVKWDREEEKFLIKDPERGLRFWAVADSPRAVVRLRKLWEEVADALYPKRVNYLKVRREWITLIPIE